MTEAEITRYITETFPGVSVVDSACNAFFFYDPARLFPFATLVTKDDYDSVSNPGCLWLNKHMGANGVRPSVFEKLVNPA